MFFKIFLETKFSQERKVCFHFNKNEFVEIAKRN